MPLAALGPSFLAMFGVILLPSVSVFMPQTPLLIILTPSVGSQGEDYEATVHVARRFICNMPSNNIFVKLDFSNDFNFLRRDFILERVHEVFPEFYKFCHLAYNHHSMLQCDKFSITLEEGTQQDDLLGVHLLCLANGKRSGGATLIPSSRDKTMAWIVTVSDTFADHT